MTVLSIAHLVVTEQFAGVERYVCEVAPRQAASGHRVMVLGGEEGAMRESLGSAVHWCAASTLPAAIHALNRAGRVDIVHCHMTSADVAAVVTKPRTRAAVVSTRHFAAPRGSRPGVRPVLRLLAHALDAEIAISHFVADTTGEALEVVVNGVAAQPERATVRGRTVLVMQRLEREKDTATALRAFAGSGLQSRGWTLTIAGRGAERASLQQLASGLGLDGSVSWLGFVSDPDSLQAAAAVHLAPATAEPFGLAVAEAMAHGTAVVASSGGAHAELLGENGWLFPPGDAAAAAALLRRAENTAVAAAYGAVLRDRQRNLFDIVAHVAALERVYAGVTL